MSCESVGYAMPLIIGGFDRGKIDADIVDARVAGGVGGADVHRVRAGRQQRRIHLLAERAGRVVNERLNDLRIELIREHCYGRAGAVGRAAEGIETGKGYRSAARGKRRGDGDGRRDRIQREAQIVKKLEIFPALSVAVQDATRAARRRCRSWPTWLAHGSCPRSQWIQRTWRWNRIAPAASLRPRDYP